MATKLATLRSRLETVRANKKTDSFLVDKAIVQSNAESRLAVADVLQPGGIVSIQRLKRCLLPLRLRLRFPPIASMAEIGAFLSLAERGGYLVLKPSRPWNHPLRTQRPIKLRCSPLVVSSVDGMRATIIMVHGDERTLARFDVSLDKVSPDPVWQWKITAHVDSYSGVIGQPVLLGGKPPADTIGAFAVRWSNGIAIYGVKADGTFKDLFDGHRYDPGCTYSGRVYPRACGGAMDWHKWRVSGIM